MMEPFDWNKPFTTRDGRKARLLGILNAGSYINCSYVVAVTDKYGKESVEYYHQGGNYRDELTKDEKDIVNIP